MRKFCNKRINNLHQGLKSFFFAMEDYIVSHMHVETPKVGRLILHASNFKILISLTSYLLVTLTNSMSSFMSFKISFVNLSLEAKLDPKRQMKTTNANRWDIFFSIRYQLWTVLKTNEVISTREATKANWSLLFVDRQFL